MCLLLFYINPAATAKEFYLVLISVRDEIYNRPTKNAHVWDSNPNVIGGVDLYPGKEGGTWLAMNKKGMIGALLNILQPDSEILPQKKGRGFLVVDFVTGDKECIDYLLKISKEKKDYNGFLLVTLDLRSFREPQMGYFTNASSTAPSLLSPGIHAFGNSCVIESQWPKTAEAKEKFAEIVAKHTSSSSKDSLVEDLFVLLRNQTQYPLDENMKKQGKGKSEEYMKKLSAVFVHIPEENYGSRSHTVILIDGSGNVDYYERSRSEDSPPDEISHDWPLCHYTHKLFTD